MGFNRGVVNSRAAGVIPVGMINYRCRVDQYGNDVSEVVMADGKKYNMVHHTPESKWWRTHATIYGGRGKFIKVRTSASDNDCVATTIEVGGYSVSWGDGDPLGVDNNPNGPDLSNILGGIQDEDFDTVIVNVLSAIEFVDAAWSYKEVQKKA